MPISLPLDLAMTPSYMTTFQSSPVIIWKTVSIAFENLSKFEGGGTPSMIDTYRPPKTCIPSKAKTIKNRNKRKINDMILFKEFIKLTTKFLKSAQALVILKILNNFKARMTENPKLTSGWKWP